MDYLCDDCQDHFAKVKSYLDSVGIHYVINPKIVRGLDYYTKTVFEFVTDCIGAQSTVCGGGRYDGLIEELGGGVMPSLGFALGMERLLGLMEKKEIKIPKPDTCDIYVIGLGKEAEKKTFQLVRTLRDASLHAQSDIFGRSLKAQMKYADKIQTKFTLVLGDDELKNHKAVLKNMETGEKHEIALDENFLESFLEVYVDYTQNQMFSSENFLTTEE